MKRTRFLLIEYFIFMYFLKNASNDLLSGSVLRARRLQVIMINAWGEKIVSAPSGVSVKKQYTFDEGGGAQRNLQERMQA